MSSFVHDPVLLEKYLEMARRRFPGPDYYEALRAIHSGFRPSVYVEIGVRAGASLACAQPECKCVAIDPNPDIKFAIPPDTTILETTSDEFFNSETAGRVLPAGFDLAFIDGLHLFEQALRDFAELEGRAHAGSVILIHDCIPIDDISSARVRTIDFYCGDVWKLPLCLRKYRPELKQAVIPAAPSGLCVVTGLDPASTVLRDRYDALVAEYVGLGFFDYVSAVNDAEEVANESERIYRYASRLRARK